MSKNLPPAHWTGSKPFPQVNFSTARVKFGLYLIMLTILIKAINPISKAMRLPKVALHSMFGKPERGSKSYTEICSIYQAKIAKGAVAAGSFLPKQEDPANPAESKNALLEKLSRSFDKLVAAIEKCEDETLDQIQLPHPLIGNLTVREMLFFTIYHTLRHASQEGD